MPLQRPQSGWLDFLDWVKDPARVVQNLDRPAMAARYLADFAAGPIDAFTPGDTFDTAVTDDERKYNPIADVALNPITYAGFIPGVRRAVPAMLAAGRKYGYEIMPDRVQRGLTTAKRTLGWDDYSQPLNIPERTYQFDPPGYKAPIDPLTGKPLPAPPVTIPARTIKPTELLSRAEGIESTSTQAQMQSLTTRTGAVGKVTPDEDKLLADVMDNLDWSSGGLVPGMLDAAHKPGALDIPAQIAAAKIRARSLAAKNPGAQVDLAKVDKLLEETYDIGLTQLKEAQQRGGIGLGSHQPDYLKRVYTGLGGAAESKPRENQGAKALIAFLKNNPKVRLNRSWSERMIERAHGQGRLLKRAYLREQLTDPTLARGLTPASKGSPLGAAAQKSLDQALQAAGPDSDIWARLRYELNGTTPQNAIEGAMRSLNRMFKPAAVYGVGPFMRIGSIVRNQLTAYWELAGTPEGRSYLLRNPAHGIRNLVGAFDDAIAKGLFGKRLTGGEITASIDALESALKASGGRVDTTVNILRTAGRNLEADALEQGILNGFVLSEDLAKASMVLRSRVNPATWMIPGHSAIADIGGKAFGGLEQRMRFGYFKDLVLNQRKDAATAAQMVKDRYLDYATNSAGNRDMRTYFPFAQFVVQSIPQQGKMLAQNPGIIPAIGALYGGDDLPDYAREQAHVGRVAPGFAPTDVFNMIPDVTASKSFDEFRRSVAKTAGMLHPAIGAGVGMVSGIDTFTRRKYLEDARLPWRDPRETERGAADVAWGLGEDLGVLQSVAGPVQSAKSLSKMNDPRLAALRYITGVNVLPENPERAEADKLRATLETDPRVKSFERMYTKSDDAQLKTALTRLEEVRKELIAKAKAAQGM